MLTPEERNGGEFFAQPQHVTSRRLSLPRGHDPMLRADGPATVTVGPAGDVTRGINVGRAGLKMAVHGDTPIERKAGCLSQLDARAHAHAQYGKISAQAFTVLEAGLPSLKFSHGISQVKLHALFLMQ